MTFNLRYAKIAVCRSDLRQGALITHGEKEKAEMKELKELKFEELSTDQKIGMVMAGILNPVRKSEEDKYGTLAENVDFVIDLIKNHSLGAVWVSPSTLESCPSIMPRIKEAADYPILIFTDAESGLGEYKVGRHNSIGIANREDLAYTFGKVTAITARNLGYNVVCNPVLDLGSGANTNRILGSDKERVTSLAAAMATGMHDGGVLTVAKHYPCTRIAIDPHMAPSASTESLDSIVNYRMYPYRELSRLGLLDGVMKAHVTSLAIDPERPASVSMKASELLRGVGFDGFFITDALDMMGVRALYGDEKLKGMCIAGGVEMILPWFSAKKAYHDLKKCYENGIFTEERLDDAVKRVLAAQHKVMLYTEPKYTEITDEDARLFEEINRSSVYAITDEGVSPSISRDGNHFFAIMVSNSIDLSDGGKSATDTFSDAWHHPYKIKARIEELFPNSKCRFFYEHPYPRQNADILASSLGCDETIFVTYAEAPAHSGSDRFTPRALALMKAMSMTDRFTTQIHFGNPYVLEDAPHSKRHIMGCVSANCVDSALEILAGNLEPTGHPTYDAKL